MLALAGLPGTVGLHRQALPDRGGRRGRLHLARRRDRDRDDGLPRLLPAGAGRGLDAARAPPVQEPPPAIAGAAPMAGGRPGAGAAALARRAAGRATAGEQPLRARASARRARCGRDRRLRLRPAPACRLGHERGRVARPRCRAAGRSERCGRGGSAHRRRDRHRRRAPASRPSCAGVTARPPPRAPRSRSRSTRWFRSSSSSTSRGSSWTGHRRSGSCSDTSP